MRVLFLGIDALDSMLLDHFIDQLPNFSRLRGQGKTLKVISTFPPDSDTAWATISTGMNPAQHGYVKFVDPLEKSYRIMNEEEDNQILRGNTFWDVLAEAGYKTCAVFPHLCYPLWQTRAVMISRAKLNPTVEATIPELLDLYPQPDLLAGIRGLPNRNRAGMEKYRTSLWKLAEADAEFALRLYKSQEWDLFFMYWSTIDAIGHFFWNSFDEKDQFYDSKNPFRDVIPETYRLFDRILGRYLDAVDDKTTVILLSDHGHGARPVETVNVNEILRESGYLVLKSPKEEPHLLLVSQLKKMAVRFISHFQLAKVAGKVLRNFPGLVQTFTRPGLINWDKTTAYATDMSGIKTYPYGGIIINRERISSQEEYETIRDRIIAAIKERCHLEGGASLLKFIARREDIYTGEYLNRYPDIVLEFQEGYGVGWAANIPLITKADAYNLVPGSHRGATGTCFIRGPHTITSNEIDLRDIYPSVLALFNIPLAKEYDGKSVFDEE